MDETRPAGTAPVEPTDRSAADDAPASTARRRRVSPVRITSVAIGALVLYYLVSLAQVVQAGRHHDATPADAIVVLGAAQYDGRPSPQLAARLDHVLVLWEQDVAPVVVVTGGKQPDDRFTEADASRRYLVDRGVPEQAVLMEDAGRTTHESLEAAAALLSSAGHEHVVLVSDPSHVKRSELIAESFGLDADVSATPSSVVGGWSAVTSHLQEAGGVALGRIIGFDRLSDLAG